MTRDVRFPIPPGTRPRTCTGKKCGEPVYWIVTAGGSPMPVNADGTSHFATCPDADNFRKGKK